MEIEIAQQGPATIIAPSGPRLDAEVATEFRSALFQLIEKGQGKLIVNLSGIDFIDSSGLGALVSALKRLKQSAAAGDIRLANVQPGVIAVLEIIRLHRVFPRYLTVDDAVNSYN